MAEEQGQTGNQQRVVDCGTRGWKGRGGRPTGRYLKAAVRYVEEQYAGPKEKLRPIHEEVLKLGKSLGDDVRACPCKTIVPLYREHGFDQIKPTTNSRIDLGLALRYYKGELPKRIIDTRGLAKKDRITHGIEITAAEEIDGEVKKPRYWLLVPTCETTDKL